MVRTMFKAALLGATLLVTGAAGTAMADTLADVKKAGRAGGEADGDGHDGDRSKVKDGAAVLARPAPLRKPRMRGSQR